MKEKRKSKWLSLLLAGVMALTLFSGMAMAEEPTEGGETQTVCTLTEGCTLSDGHDGACVTNNAGEDGNEGQQGINLLTGAAPANAGDVAQIGAQTYPTLEAAVAAVQSGETIVLLQDASGNGIKVPENSSFTLDLGGYTYTVNGQTVGSTGTETLGFQLLKGSTITIKNGAITAQSAQAYPVGILIQNYSNLTLDNVQLTGATNTLYVLSNNYGDTVLKNNTVINATDGNVAFNVYYGMSDAYKDGVSVTIEDSSVQVTGKIEYGMAGTADEAEFAAKASLNVPAGYTGVAAPDGYEWVTTSGGAQKLQNTSYVAKVGDVAYPTLEAAVAAAQDGQTVTLLNNTDGENSARIEFAGKDLVLDLNGHTADITAITANTGATLTIDDSTAVSDPVVGDDYQVTYSAGKLKVSAQVLAAGGGQVILKNGIVESSYLGLMALGDSTGAAEVASTVTVEGGYIIAQEFAVTAQGRGAKIYFENGVAEARDNAVIAGNGSNTEGNRLGGTEINISGGTLIGHITTGGYVSCGIYHPQDGTLNISGGTIYSDNGCGILMRGGELDMTGGTIIAEGDITTTGKVGDSRVVVPTSGVVLDLDAGYYDTSNAAIKISGNASVSGTKSAVEVLDSNSIYTENQIAISAGLFSSDVIEYVVAGNTTSQNTDGSFSIVVDQSTAVAEANGSGFTTLQAAIDAAAANGGGTVTLLQNTQENIEIPAGADITLNLPEGVTLTNDPTKEAAHTITNRGSLTVTGSGTVDNVTHARAALVNYGTAVLEGGLFTRSAEASTSPSNNGGNSYYVVDNQGDMTITGTAAVRNKGYYSSLIRNLGSNADDRASLIITGGTLEQDGFIAVKNDDYGNLTISGGVISSGEQAVQNWSDADISGGTLNGPVITWSYAGHASTTDISADAVVNGNVWAVNYDGSADIPTITITGGTVTGSLAKGSYRSGIQMAAPNSDSAEILVSGGTFSAAVDEAFCADNFHPNQNADGTYSVHTHVSDGGVITTPVTDTTDGVKTYTCTICGEVIQTEIIPAHVHDAAWSHDPNVHWHECPTCGRVDEAAHTFGEWTVTKAATADVAGSQERICTVCGYKETAVIPATGEEQQGGGQQDGGQQGGGQQSGGQQQSSTPASSSQTDTGDESNPALWVALILVCALGLGATAVIRKKSAR